MQKNVRELPPAYLNLGQSPLRRLFQIDVEALLVRGARADTDLEALALKQVNEKLRARRRLPYLQWHQQGTLEYTLCNQCIRLRE